MEDAGLTIWHIKDLQGLGTYGSIRNALSKMKTNGYIKSPYRGGHSLTTKGKLFDDKLPYGGVLDLRALLEDVAAFEDPAVHNIRLSFRVVGMYLHERGRLPWVEMAGNGGLLQEFRAQSRRLVKVMVFSSDRVQVIVACSGEPYHASLDGLLVLAADLGGVHSSIRIDGLRFPSVSDWVVDQWEWARDSKGSIEGHLSVTFRTLYDELARIYNRKGRIRVERKERVNQPITDLIERFLGGKSG
jgi:hypothetical protein